MQILPTVSSMHAFRLSCCRCAVTRRPAILAHGVQTGTAQLDFELSSAASGDRGKGFPFFISVRYPLVPVGLRIT
ncbi:hypothetical protein C8Q78DRAFT_1044779 [Trametes maxima]|nr:hypothetical protein C8Q78DRAFT_1044779 [Trametes maxima]